MSRSSQGGFTLIELVVVIVILGILAAYAVPRFSRLDRQARAASVRSLEGTMRSASTMAHGMWLAQGTNPATVAVEGANVAMVNGYPSRAGIVAALGVGTVQAGPGRFTATNVNANAVDLIMNGAANGNNCRVRYTEAANLNAAPTFQVVLGANGNDC